MKFFVINSRSLIGSQYEVNISPINRSLGDAPRCPLCKRPIGQRRWLAPRVADIKFYSRQYRDLIYSTGDLLVSERFRSTFLAEALKGLKFYPLEVRKGKAVVSDKLFFAEIARGGAAVDVEASELERGPAQCVECRTMLNLERFSRIVLENGSWDGLDIFIARGLPGTKIVSERFKKLCEKHDFGGLILSPAETFSHDGMPWTKRNNLDN